jgi:hypothetical protein
MTDRQGESGGVLRLRNRRAKDPAWRERLEQQQVLARLGRMFGRAASPLQAMHDHAEALMEELRLTPLDYRGCKSRDERGG